MVPPYNKEPTKKDLQRAKNELKKYVISTKTSKSALELLLSERGSNENNS